MFHNFLGPDFASNCGFEEDHAHRTAFMAEQDDKTARAARRLLIHTVRPLFLTNLWYEHMPPLAFVGFTLSDTTQTFEKCKQAYTVLEALEKTARASPQCSSFVNMLCFPQEQWTREIFVRLEENNFASLDHGLQEDIRHYVDAQKSTLVCENGFGQIRRTERQHLNGSMIPETAWWGFAHGGLLEDFDRAPPQVTTAAKACAPTELSPFLFDCDDEENCSSLFPEVLDTIHEENPAWSKLNAYELFRMAVIRWLCALEHGGDFQRIQDTWPSMLPQPGTLLRRDGQGEYVVTLRCSAFGVLAMKVKLQVRPVSVW